MATFAPAAHADVHSAVPHKTRRRHPWLIALGVIILAVIGLAILGSVDQPATVNCQPPKCSLPPPKAQLVPLAPPERYVSSTYGFSLAYDTSNISPSQMDDKSISWQGTLRDNSQVAWTFLGFTPRGRDAHQAVDQAQQNGFADATFAYAIPGADIGYTPGYGAVYDFSSAPGGGASVHERLIIIAAIKQGVGVLFVGMGPYVATDPKTDGHPNPADTPLVGLSDFEENIKSVVWKGDQPL